MHELSPKRERKKKMKERRDGQREGGRKGGRREKKLSQVVVYCKNSTGKDNETPLIKKQRNERNHKMTSEEIHPEEKSITELSSFL